MEGEERMTAPVVHKKQQDRKLMLQEYLKKKVMTNPSATPTHIKSDKHSTTVTPLTRPQPPPAPHKSAHKYDKISKALFQEKENIHENKRSNNITVNENENNLPMEEKLRRWKERKQQHKPTSKPRPNPASFTSTSSLFDHPNSFPRPAPARPAPAPIHARTAQEIHVEQAAFTQPYVAQDAHERAHAHAHAHAETGNDTGNEGGDEGDQRASLEGQAGGEQEEKRVQVAGEDIHDGEGEIAEDEGEMVEGGGEALEEQVESSMDMSALLPSDDEEVLKGLGEWQRRFQQLYSKIEEKLVLIQEGALSTESVRTWIKNLKPTYNKMTQFYVLWANFEERLMMYDNASAVYDLGLQDQAEPQYELLKEYRAFLDRKAQSDISRFNKTVEALSSSLAQSKLLQSPPRSSITQPTSTRKPSRTPSKRLLTPSRVLSSDTFDNTLPISREAYRDTTHDYREPQRERRTEGRGRESMIDADEVEQSPACKGDLNESLLDNFQHMGILTPRVYKSTPPRHATTIHTPPHTPPSIPNEICDFSPVSPESPPRNNRLMTPSRVINMEAILRDSVKKVLSHYDATPSKFPSYVVFEKVPLSKEEGEALGAEYAVTPVRKFGVRPRSTNRNLLDENVLFKDEEEPDEQLVDIKKEVKTEVKEEEYQVSNYNTDAELADDEKREEVHSDSKSVTKKTPKNRKRSRSACPLVSATLGTCESLEITRKRNNTNLEEAISLVATPHRSALATPRKSTQGNVTPANTPKRKKVRVEVEPEVIGDDESEGEDTISVTNVRRSQRISLATPIKLPSQKKPVKVIFTPNYHRSSNANQLAQMIDMTQQDFYISSD